MAVTPEPPLSLQQRTDHWFRRVSGFLLGQLPCRAGCSRCCIGPFAITVLDWLTLREGLTQLPSAVRQDIERRALEQTKTMEGAYPVLKQSKFLDHWADRDIDRLVSQFETVPCPALGENGLCQVYEHRPLTCRSMGVPVEQSGQVYGACEVQSFVPIVTLSASLRAEEQALAGREAAELEALRTASGFDGEELLLPYGFLPD
jgi:Fe-S-cluster containining protein